MRVYLPATVATVAAHLASGTERTLPAGPAYAVTPALIEWYAEGDVEEMEYAALTLAAEASVALLAADPAVRRRRVVVAADVPDSDVSMAPDPSRDSRGRLEVRRPITLDMIAALHVDDARAESDVAAAVADPDDDFAAGGAADHELLWYATQEIDALLAELGG